MTTEDYYTLTYKIPGERNARVEYNCTHIEKMSVINAREGIIGLAYKDACNVRHYVAGAEWAEVVKEWADE